MNLGVVQIILFLIFLTSIARKTGVKRRGTRASRSPCSRVGYKQYFLSAVRGWKKSSWKISGKIHRAPHELWFFFFNDWPWKAGVLTWNRLPSTGVKLYRHHTNDSSTTLTLQTNRTERQSPLPTTVLLRTTLTRTIKLHYYCAFSIKYSWLQQIMVGRRGYYMD